MLGFPASELRDRSPDAAEVLGGPKNWSSGQQLGAGRQRWYFVGIDANGRKVKGEAVIDLKPELE